MQIERLKAEAGLGWPSREVDWAVVWGLVSRLQPLRSLALHTQNAPPVNLNLSPAEPQLQHLQVLNLTKSNLTEVPSAVQYFTQLVQLTLDFNSLTALPSWLQGLTRLQRISARSNQIAHIPDSAMAALTQLTCLDLGHNRIPALADSVYGLTSLKELLLEHNELTSLSDDLQHLRSLTRLEVWENRLQSLPHSIGSMAQLRRLRFDNNPGIVLPDGLFRLTALNELVLTTSGDVEADFTTSAGHNALPEAFGNLLGLQVVQIGGAVAGLQPSLPRLTNLRTLYLCDAQTFPRWLGSLSTLTCLALSGIEGRPIPSTYGALTALASLELENCPSLRRLPNSLVALTKLTQLIVTDCPELAYSGARGIECIGYMTQLRTLILDSCDLSDVCELSRGHDRLGNESVCSSKMHR